MSYSPLLVIFVFSQLSTVFPAVLSHSLHQEKMSVQTDHHEQLYALLSEEKDRLSQDLASLRSELQEQAHTFANEKAQYIEEFNTVQRESEIEGDVRVAEQIKVISTIKAEMAAKVRLMQVGIVWLGAWDIVACNIWDNNRYASAYF